MNHSPAAVSVIAVSVARSGIVVESE